MSDKKYKQAQNVDAPHMGSFIKNYLRTHNISGASLARKMQRSPVTISNYYKNRSLQMHIIWEISHALQHNFFEDMAAMVPAEFSHKPSVVDPELERLRIENELLKELLKR